MLWKFFFPAPEKFFFIPFSFSKYTISNEKNYFMACLLIIN